MTTLIQQLTKCPILALAICGYPAIAVETLDSVRLVRAEGWEWDHEVRVYSPPSYGITDQGYARHSGGGQFGLYVLLNKREL